MIIQTVTYVCEFCGKMHSLSKEAWGFDDYIITIPDGWDGNVNVPKESRKNRIDDIAIACPACKDNPDWSKYR